MNDTEAKAYMIGHHEGYARGRKDQKNRRLALLHAERTSYDGVSHASLDPEKVIATAQRYLAFLNGT
jgi:hypothetical protein